MGVDQDTGVEEFVGSPMVRDDNDEINEHNNERESQV